MKLHKISSQPSSPDAASPCVPLQILAHCSASETREDLETVMWDLWECLWPNFPLLFKSAKHYSCGKWLHTDSIQPWVVHTAPAIVGMPTDSKGSAKWDPLSWELCLASGSFIMHKSHQWDYMSSNTWPQAEFWWNSGLFALFQYVKFWNITNLHKSLLLTVAIKKKKKSLQYHPMTVRILLSWIKGKLKYY